MTKCTEGQIYDAICDYWDEHGYGPSVRDICAKTHMSSTSTIHARLMRMEHKGMIRSRRMTARTIVPIPREEWEDADA